MSYTIIYSTLQVPGVWLFIKDFFIDNNKNLSSSTVYKIKLNKLREVLSYDVTDCKQSVTINETEVQRRTLKLFYVQIQDLTDTKIINYLGTKTFSVNCYITVKKTTTSKQFLSRQFNRQKQIIRNVCYRDFSWKGTGLTLSSLSGIRGMYFVFWFWSNWYGKGRACALKVFSVGLFSPRFGIFWMCVIIFSVLVDSMSLLVVDLNALRSGFSGMNFLSDFTGKKLSLLSNGGRPSSK